MTFGPAISTEINYRLNQARNVQFVVSDQSKPAGTTAVASITPAAELGKPTLFGGLTGGNKVEILRPVSAQFGILIPKIGANAPVFPNVNAGKRSEYLSVLKKGVAHAEGTVFPGSVGNIFLFAHSTDAFWNVGRYNAIFYLLKELQNGDEVDVFYQGRRFAYRVVNKLIVSANEVSWLTRPTNYEQLTLQTCWPPGTTLKRLVVLARPEKDLLR